MAQQDQHQIVALVDGRFTYKGDVTKEDHSSEVLAVHKFEGPVARVRRSFGLTMSLPQKYEMARLDVSIEVPCYLEDAAAADEWASAWVEERIQREVAKVRGVKTPPKGTRAKTPSY